mgnify:FL=1
MSPKILPFLNSALNCARRQAVRLRALANRKQLPRAEPAEPLTISHAPVGVELATQTRQDAVQTFLGYIKNAMTGKGREKRPFLTMSSLPRQGKSLALDIVQQRLIDAGIFAVCTTYNSYTPVDVADADPRLAAARFWWRVVARLVDTYAMGTPIPSAAELPTFYTADRVHTLIQRCWPTLRCRHAKLPESARGSHVVLCDEFS